MAYMNQEMKKKIAENVKPILKKYGVTGSLSVKHHSTIVLTISKGDIDFLGDSGETYRQVNPFYYERDYTGKALDFFKEVIPHLFGEDYYDNSDAMTDYFDTSYYVNVNVGRWDKPYVLLKK